MSLGLGRASQATKVRTTCSYCGVGCNYDLNVRNGKVIRVTSASDAPVNGRALCVKGRYWYDYIHHPERLTRPLVRPKWLDPGQVEEKLASGEWRMKSIAAAEPKKGRRKGAAAVPPGKQLSAGPHESADPVAQYVEVDWDTALDVVTRKWAQVKAESGGDAFAVLTSAKCTNEENYLVNKLTRQVLQTNSLDHCARL
jgi:formate dehydrogenase major subunit/formate dehydrogenase alpha subunit